MKLSFNESNKTVWAIAFPMLLSGISTPLLGMVDTAVVGHLSEAYYLGAIALGAMIFTFVFWTMGFLRMSTTGLTARASGAENLSEVNNILVRGVCLAFFIGLLFVALQFPIKLLAFSFIESSQEIIFHAENYFDIRIWAAPATLGTYVLLGWFLGLQKPGLNLLVVVSINLLNIVLDLLLVFGLGLNSSGVAWATLIAEYVGLFLALYLVIKNTHFDFSKVTWSAVFQWALIKNYLSINLNVFLRTLFLLLSFSFFTLQGAKFGPIVLAANAVLMNFQTFMAYALDSLAHAAEVLVGKSLGSSDRDALKSVLWISAGWSLLIAVVFSLFYWLVGEAIINGLTDLSEIRQMAMIYLPWLIVSPLVSVWSYWFDGVFIGAGYSVEMRNTMFWSFVVFFIAWYLLLPWENHGLWAALMIFMIARALTMAFSARRRLLFQ